MINMLSTISDKRNMLNKWQLLLPIIMIKLFQKHQY